MDARNIQFDAEFDVIGAFEVLDYLAEDMVVLSEMYRTVRPGGGIPLAVAQNAFLWSMADKPACNVRRYSNIELKNKVMQAGFSVVRSTSFVSLLLPLMLLSRIRRRTTDVTNAPLAKLKIGGFTHWSHGIALDLEHAFIHMGISLPTGESLLLIARKNT